MSGPCTLSRQPALGPLGAASCPLVFSPRALRTEQRAGQDSAGEAGDKGCCVWSPVWLVGILDLYQAHRAKRRHVWPVRGLIASLVPHFHGRKH